MSGLYEAWGTRKPTLQEKRQEGDEEDEQDRHDATTDPFEYGEEEVAATLSAKQLTGGREFADGELGVESAHEYHYETKALALRHAGESYKTYA